MQLAGIVTPNDGECHLDNEGYYTFVYNLPNKYAILLYLFSKSTEQDYPSVALLHQKIKEKKVNMIFAVTQSNQRLYQQVIMV